MEKSLFSGGSNIPDRTPEALGERTGYDGVLAHLTTDVSVLTLIGGGVVGGSIIDPHR